MSNYWLDKKNQEENMDIKKNLIFLSEEEKNLIKELKKISVELSYSKKTNNVPENEKKLDL